MRIDFLHPEFHIGINSTVRLGTRYVELDENLELYKTGEEEPVAYGMVTKYLVCNFNNLTDEDIMYQHDEETMNYDGLYKAMERAYGDKFSEDSVVTVIYFLIV